MAQQWRRAEVARLPMPYSGDAARYPLHAAAEEGRLADLAAWIRAKEAEGSLAAGEPHLRMLSRVALPHP